MKNLIYYADTRRNAAAAVAGTTDVVGVVIDMQGYQAIVGIVLLGALVAGQQTKLICEQSSVIDGSTDPFTKIGETAYAGDADTNKVLELEINEPTKRYLRFTVKRATQNAAIDGILVQLHRASLMPVTQHATVSDRKLFVSPSGS